MSPGWRIMVTGHRSQRIAGREQWVHDVCNYVLGHLQEMCWRHGCELAAVSGMAIGCDMIFADVALRRAVPLAAHPPGRWQPDRWNFDDVASWKRMIEHATWVEWPEGDPPFSPGLFRWRNARMVETSHCGLAFYDGGSGGTKHAVDLLLAAGKPCMIVHPDGSGVKTVCGADGLPWFGLDKPEDVHALLTPYGVGAPVTAS